MLFVSELPEHLHRRVFEGAEWIFGLIFARSKKYQKCSLSKNCLKINIISLWELIFTFMSKIVHLKSLCPRCFWLACIVVFPTFWTKLCNFSNIFFCVCITCTIFSLHIFNRTKLPIYHLILFAQLSPYNLLFTSQLCFHKCQRLEHLKFFKQYIIT